MGGKEPPPALQQHNSWVLNIFSDSLTDRCIALLRQIQKLGEKERIDSKWNLSRFGQICPTARVPFLADFLPAIFFEAAS